MQEILPEVFYLPNILTSVQQQLLLSQYVNHKEWFYQPILSSGRKMSLKMNCLGKEWSAKDYCYHDHRIDVDQKKVLPITQNLLDLVNSFNYTMPYIWPNIFDTCVINYYHSGANLGLHQDNSESQESLSKGYPVVSFSLGASCLFKIGGNNRYDSATNLELHNGDLLVFGGKSRLRYHGVTGILTDFESPYYQELNSGRLNFTFRKI